MKDGKDGVTVRRLGGEIWAEIGTRQLDGSVTSLRHVPSEAVNELVDMVMGVLARYDGYKLLNDEDLPVKKLDTKRPGSTYR